MALNFCADVPLRTYSLSLSHFTGSTFSESSLSFLALDVEPWAHTHFLALTLNLRLARTLAAIVSQTVLWQSLSLIRCCISRLSCTLHGRLAWPHSASRTTIDITKAAGCIVVVLCKAILNSSITANVSTGASFVWLSTGLCVSVLYPIIMINVSIITVVFSVQFCKQLSVSSPDYLILSYFYLEWHWMAYFCADVPLRTYSLSCVISLGTTYRNASIIVCLWLNVKKREKWKKTKNYWYFTCQQYHTDVIYMTSVISTAQWKTQWFYGYTILFCLTIRWRVWFKCTWLMGHWIVSESEVA